MPLPIKMTVRIQPGHHVTCMRISMPRLSGSSNVVSNMLEPPADWAIEQPANTAIPAAISMPGLHDAERVITQTRPRSDADSSSVSLWPLPNVMHGVSMSSFADRV